MQPNTLTRREYKGKIYYKNIRNNSWRILNRSRSRVRIRNKLKSRIRILKKSFRIHNSGYRYGTAGIIPFPSICWCNQKVLQTHSRRSARSGPCRTCLRTETTRMKNKHDKIHKTGVPDPSHLGTDPHPDPRIRTSEKTGTDPAPFVNDLQDANKNYFFLSILVNYFLKIHLHHYYY